MRNLSRSSWWWIAGGIFLSLLVMIFTIGARGETKLKAISPDGRYIAYGRETPDWFDLAAFLIPPLQGRTGCRFVVTDTRSGRTRQLFAWEENYELDGVFEMATTPRHHSIFWSPDSTTVACTLRIQGHADPEYDELHTRAFAIDKPSITEVPAATAWFAECLFHELQSADAARRAVAEQLITHSNLFNGGVKHLALWSTREADAATLEKWHKRLQEYHEFGTPTPTASLSENKPTVRRTVVGGKPRQDQSVYVDSSWNAKGLFLSVRAIGELRGCSKETDILLNGCSAVRVHLSHNQHTSSKEYVFARVNGRSTTLAGTAGKTLTTSKSARCSVRISPPSTVEPISYGHTDWQAFIPWGDFGVLPKDVRPGRKLPFAMTVISATTSGTAKTEWFMGVDSDDRNATLSKGKLFLMP